MHLDSADLRKPVFHSPEEYVTDIYNLAVFPYEGIYIGMLTVFNHSGNTSNNSDGFSMVELAMSRDLVHWQRVGDRAKFMPLSRLADASTYDTAQLLAADFLPGTWVPDDRTRMLRRLVMRRTHLVKQRTRLKNQVHGILSRNLVPTCPHADLFSGIGRRWLAGQQLPETSGAASTR